MSDAEDQDAVSGEAGDDSGDLAEGGGGGQTGGVCGLPEFEAEEDGDVFGGRESDLESLFREEEDWRTVGVPLKRNVITSATILVSLTDFRPMTSSTRTKQSFQGSSMQIRMSLRLEFRYVSRSSH